MIRRLPRMEPEVLRALEPRLWSRVDRSQFSPGGCWVWVGSVRGGYGRITAHLGDRDSGIDTHVLAYWLAGGEIRDGFDVRHLCHNRRCCNPAHLRTGTRLDNMRDSMRDGRVLRGVDRPDAKLTDGQVLEIRSMRCGGVQQAEIARRFGVSQSLISKIVRGKRWKHLSAAANDQLVAA